MIVFNSVKVTQDNKNLIIDAEINHNDFFKDMYITDIYIDNQDTFVQSGPSNNPVYHKVIEPIKSGAGEISYSKSVYLALDKSDIFGGIENNILFVYVVVDGIPDPNTPCGLDNKVYLKAAINTYPLYSKLMTEFSKLSDTCIIPPSLIDTILNIEALDINIKTGNNLKAIDIWNRYFKNISKTVTTNCNCNGRY